MNSSNFVFVASPGLTAWGSHRLMLELGDAWYADDPFVLDRPELFSATPIEASSTTGKASPGATPIPVREDAPVRVGRPRRG